ncbi:TPA: hypothetical protein VMB01_001176 [Streptococcus pyogenes]|nr:hypothetical protein [Streptococcus pyogenes]HER7133247.1 hypothetical protein [Streptococcus pyogenes]HES7967408.1 hypothetical protein [Streptococcus pyogenes]
MKTKSKRFLNLATLCLALLGTTLLMTRPVKAEVVTQTPEGKVTKAEGRDNVDDEAQKYQRRWEAGHKKGYEKGKEPDSPREPQEIPEGTGDDYGDGYSDGYSTGYGEGWYDSHPITALLDMAWYYLTYAFGALFGGANS